APPPPDPWAGPLLPPGWRPDRETPPEDDRMHLKTHPVSRISCVFSDASDEQRWRVLDSDGHLGLGDGTEIALRPFPPGDGGLLLDVAVLDALSHGIERFEGLVLGENISSRRMLARGGATFRPEGGGVLAFRLLLRPRADLLRATPLPGVVASQSRRTGLIA